MRAAAEVFGVAVVPGSGGGISTVEVRAAGTRASLAVPARDHYGAGATSVELCTDYSHDFIAVYAAGEDSAG